MSPAPEKIIETPSPLRRLACMVYETLLLSGVVFAAGFLFSILTQTRNALDNRLGMQIFLFVVLGGYFAWFWSKGQTLAMKTWHLHLQDESGQLISQNRAITRYLSAWVWITPPVLMASLLGAEPKATIAMAVIWIGIWFMLCYTRQDRQFLHDVWSGTKLVYIQPNKPK